MNNIPHIVDTGASISKIDETFEEWKPILKHIMEYKLLQQENETLRSQIRFLEQQVYGGKTK